MSNIDGYERGVPKQRLVGLQELADMAAVRKQQDLAVEATDTQYEDYLRHVFYNGTAKGDRTGTGTKSVFGYQMRWNLQQGFPLVTTKKIFTKAIIIELLWFLRGETNVKFLTDNGVTIWDEWANHNGDLGPVYGVQWRSWPNPNSHTGFTDQIAEALKLLKTTPDSRRIMVSAWNVADLDQMALMPCHALFQFYTTELTLAERLSILQVRFPEYLGVKSHDKFDGYDIPRRRLSCQLYQRSVDSFLGLPFNIASYALLTHMFAQQCNMVVGDFIWTGGDCHIYDNHTEQVEEQLSRSPYPFPQLVIKRKPDSIDDYKLEDFEFVNYQHHPAIKAPIAI